jgi:hypothetical protein
MYRRYDNVRKLKKKKKNEAEAIPSVRPHSSHITGELHSQSRCKGEKKKLRMPSVWSVTLVNLVRADKGEPFEAVALPVSRRNSRSSEALRRYRAKFFLTTI